LRDIRRVCLWSQVEEQETLLEEFEKKVEAQRGMITNLQQSAEVYRRDTLEVSQHAYDADCKRNSLVDSSFWLYQIEGAFSSGLGLRLIC
jgi:hypothetical protein